MSGYSAVLSLLRLQDAFGEAMYVVQDGLLITGQNPASSAAAADVLIKAVGA
jgi:putative intracellular protease/amidase